MRRFAIVLVVLLSVFAAAKGQRDLPLPGMLALSSYAKDTGALYPAKSSKWRGCDLFGSLVLEESQLGGIFRRYTLALDISKLDYKQVAIAIMADYDQVVEQRDSYIMILGDRGMLVMMYPVAVDTDYAKLFRFGENDVCVVAFYMP